MKNFTLRLYLHLSKSFLDHGDDEMTKYCLSIFSHSQRNPNQTDKLKNRKRKKKSSKTHACKYQPPQLH